MGHYACVIPVDWPVLTFRVLPAWLDLVAGRHSLSSFMALLGMNPTDSPEWIRFPERYLDEFGDAVHSLPFDASRLRASALHREAQRLTADDTATEVFSDAVISLAAFDLLGDDAFKSHPWNGFYSRLHRPPGVQAVLTKNAFHFLNAFFDMKDTGEGPLEYPRKAPDRPGPGDELLEQLFLGFRSVPGLMVLNMPGTWPAFGTCDYLVGGYLSPDETRALTALLPRLRERLDAFDYTSDESDGFDLFVDRVSRAASQGAGLMSFYGTC